MKVVIFIVAILVALGAAGYGSEQDAAIEKANRCELILMHSEDVVNGIDPIHARGWPARSETEKADCAAYIEAEKRG